MGASIAEVTMATGPAFTGIVVELSSVDTVEVP
jgi:hypothetical protein